MIFWDPGVIRCILRTSPYSASSSTCPSAATPFHCEVYYINKTEEMAIRWGTDRRVAFVDNSLEPPLPLSIGAAGELTIRVKDSRKLVVKLVGTEAALGQDRFMAYMRSIINMAVKPVLARVMQSGEFSIFGVDAHMDELAAVLRGQLIPEFEDYGIELRRFMILSIAKPEDDPMYQRYYRAISDQSLNVLERRPARTSKSKKPRRVGKLPSKTPRRPSSTHRRSDRPRSSTPMPRQRSVVSRAIPTSRSAAST
ncbi:MAG: SPFH domain-containing protein [Coriobacteriales bacterium]